MLIEFHVTAEKLKALLLSRIRQQKICVTNEFEALGDVHVLDHVEFLDTGFFERASASATIHVPNAPDTSINATLVRYVQPVLLAATKLSTLEAHNAEPSPPDKSPTISLLLNLSMRVQSGIPQFRITLDSVDAELLDAVAPGTSALIASHVSLDVTNNMDLSAIASMFKTSITATNAGMVVDANGNRVTMRIEVNSTTNTVSSWQSFFTGSVPNLLGGQEWSLLVDKGLMVPVVVSRVAEGLQDADDFSLDSGPSGSWSFVGGPRVNVWFSGEQIDACTCFFSEIDVDVDLSVKLSVPQNNVLRMKTKMDWDLDDGEVLCCAITTAAFWPVVGAIMLGNEEIDWLEFLGGLALGPLAVFIGVIATASSKTPEMEPSGNCTKLSDTEIQCEESVSLNAGFGSMTLTGIDGLAEGPLLKGTLFTGPEFGHGKLITVVSPFTWGVFGSCNAGFHVSNRAHVTMTNAGSAPVSTCEIKVIEDSLNVYWIQIKDGGYPPQVGAVGSVVIEPNLTDAFLQQSYPCKLMIKSSGGARIITIPPPTGISEAEVQELQTQALIAKVGCYRMADPFWRLTGRMNPKWLVDPPPDGEIFEHLWSVFVSGLAPGEQVVAWDSQGMPMARAAADSLGTARVSAIVAPAASASAAEFTLGRIGGAVGGAPMAETGPLHAIAVPASPTPPQAETVVDESRRVLIRQSTLIRRATLPLYSRCRRLLAERVRGVPSIIAFSDDGVRVFDVRLPVAPTLAASIRANGLRGVALAGDRLIVWNDEGLASFAPDESQVGFSPARRYRVVHDVIAVGGRVAVLTDEGVEILESDLTPIGRRAARGAYLARAGKRLAVGDAQGVELVDLPVLGAARREGREAMTHPRARNPAIGDRPDLDVPTGQRIAIERLSAAGISLRGRVGPQIDEAEPWRARAARVGRLIARIDPGDASLGLYELAHSYDD